MINPYSFGGGAAVGGWKEIGRTTLGSANSNVTVSGLSDKRYYMMLYNMLGRNAVDTDAAIRVGNGSISGSNFSMRTSRNGTADGTATSSAIYMADIPADGSTPADFGVGYISNYATKEKLLIHNNIYQRTAGAGNTPIRAESVGKWANTTNPIDIIETYTGGSNTWNTGSEVVILGYDPADTHTTNFWEELDSVTLTVSGDNLTSNVFTAKKYLWIQAFTKNTGGATRASLRVGNTTIDSGSNYAYRRNNNGAGEEVFPSVDRMGASSGAVADDEFWNVFIINNSGNEKLSISHDVRRSTAGAGNTPSRDETTGKWTNTSSQINKVEFFNDQAGSFDVGSIIKVWGSN